MIIDSSINHSNNNITSHFSKMQCVNSKHIELTIAKDIKYEIPSLVHISSTICDLTRVNSDLFSLGYIKTEYYEIERKY